MPRIQSPSSVPHVSNVKPPKADVLKVTYANLADDFEKNGGSDGLLQQARLLEQQCKVKSEHKRSIASKVKGGADRTERSGLYVKAQELYQDIYRSMAEQRLLDAAKAWNFWFALGATPTSDVLQQVQAAIQFAEKAPGSLKYELVLLGPLKTASHNGAEVRFEMHTPKMHAEPHRPSPPKPRPASPRPENRNVPMPDFLSSVQSVSGQDAEAFLSAFAPGAYILRPSGSEPGSFALSIVAAPFRVVHVRIALNEPLDRQLRNVAGHYSVSPFAVRFDPNQRPPDPIPLPTFKLQQASAERCSAALQGQAPGSCILRPSQSRPGDYTMQFVARNGAIKAVAVDPNAVTQSFLKYLQQSLDLDLRTARLVEIEVPPQQPDHLGYYQALGLNQDATPDQIKKAFQKLALRCHPDKVRDDDPEKAAKEDQFKRLNNAHEVLSDPGRRARYDAGDLKP